MKVEHGMTSMVEFPLEEMDRLMEAGEQAEKTGDTEALKWIYRRLRWLWDEGDFIHSYKYSYSADLFNKTWAMIINNDPPPETIAGIISREDEPEPFTATDARKALKIVRLFFENSLGGKSFKAACASLDALSEAVKTAEAEK
jgi:hypothetical protein